MHMLQKQRSVACRHAHVPTAPVLSSKSLFSVQKSSFVPRDSPVSIAECAFRDCTFALSNCQFEHSHELSDVTRELPAVVRAHLGPQHMF